MMTAKALAFSTLRGACKVLPGSVYRRLHARGIDPMYRALRSDHSYSIRHAGGRLWLPATDSSLNRDLLLRGSYEPDAVAAFLAALEPGMTVFDLGANIGYYSTAAAAAVGPAGQVYAFEPDPRNVEVLRRNCAQAHGAPINVIAAAVGEREGTSSLFVNPADSSINSLARANADVLGIQHAASPLTVPALTLDTFVRQEGSRQPDVIKMDVQGAEMLVLTGADEMLSRRPLKIFLEFWPFGLQQLGTQPIELLEFLIGKGFTLQPLGAGEEVPLTTPAAAASFVQRWNPRMAHARTWHTNFLAFN
ncbi:MAG TPA: FkbM family methyltransferase [Gemmatimonadales bacterium]|nr:FkbM family methyltransferase [Gemmatimonadales bacterium]